MFVNKAFMAQWLGKKKILYANFLLYVSYIEAIIYLLLHNLRDCTFNNHLNYYF